MSYVKNNLRPEEYIICFHKFHWATFIIPCIASAIFISCIKITPEFPENLLVIFPICYCIAKLIMWKTSEFVVTNTRVVIKYGLIFRTTFELLNQKIEGCDVYQGVLGRILKYGTITIKGTGATKQSIHRILKPMEFRDAIYDEIENLRIKNN